ncbi:MAG: roadblock/LC7 domain-containing protein [Promethearchaeota archaeon]
MLLAEKSLQKLLNRLKSNTNITNALLITEDGLLIAADEDSDNLDFEYKDNFIKIGAISAGIISMSERVLEIITEKKLGQILLNSGDNNKADGITMILTLLYENIILLVLFPSKINIGLVLYEIERLKEEITQFMIKNSENTILNLESVL